LTTVQIFSLVVGFAIFFGLNNSNQLKDVLHVPDINKNLLSVSTFARDNNVFLNFILMLVMSKIKLQSRQLLKEISNIMYV